MYKFDLDLIGSVLKIKFKIRFNLLKKIDFFIHLIFIFFSYLIRSIHEHPLYLVCLPKGRAPIEKKG